MVRWTKELLVMLKPRPFKFQEKRVSCAQCGFECDIVQWYGQCKGRTYKRYCSNACKQKAYRIRNGQRYDRPGRPKK